MNNRLQDKETAVDRRFIMLNRRSMMKTQLQHSCNITTEHEHTQNKTNKRRKE